MVKSTGVAGVVTYIVISNSNINCCCSTWFWFMWWNMPISYMSTMVIPVTINSAVCVVETLWTLGMLINVSDHWMVILLMVVLLVCRQTYKVLEALGELLEKLIVIYIQRFVVAVWCHGICLLLWILFWKLSEELVVLKHKQFMLTTSTWWNNKYYY